MAAPTTNAKIERIFKFLKDKGKLRSQSLDEFRERMQSPERLNKVFSYLQSVKAIDAKDLNTFRTNIGIDPKEGAETATKKRARIIANSAYPEFQDEFERTKQQYLKHYPGGVEFVQAYGYDELNKAFESVGADEDVILMAHHNQDAMFGVPVADKTMQTLYASQGQTLSSLFSGLQKKGYKGNCYLGICHSENIASAIQQQGVDIPFFATPKEHKWVGGNPGNNGSFEEFFFGVGGAKGSEDFGKPIDPEIDEDYKLMFSKRQQELMKRRSAGKPMTTVTPFKTTTDKTKRV